MPLAPLTTKTPRASRMRLAGLMLATVTLCMLFADLAWNIPAYFIQHSEVHENTRRDVQTLVQAAIDPDVFPTLQYETDIIKRLITLSAVAGGRIEDTAGEPLANIGELPNLTVLEAYRSEIEILESADDRFLDVLVGVERSQLAHPIVLRVDLAPAYADLRWGLLDQTAEMIAVSFIGSIGIFLALYSSLFRPLSLIRNAVLRGVKDQDIAHKFQIDWTRGDELGTLATAVNTLLQAASENYDEALHTAHEVSERSLIATLAYLPSGELSFANPAALQLLGMEAFEELAQIDQRFLKIKHAASPTADPISIEEALVDGAFADEGMLLTPAGPKMIICIGTITYRDDGSVRRYVVQLLDAQASIARIQRLEAANERASERRIAAEQRAVSLRSMLESCTIIMEDETPVDKKQATIEVETTLKAWAQTAARVGKARRVLYNRLPALNGSATLVPMLFRQILTYMDFRSAYRNSEFRIIGKNDSGMVTFDITESVTEMSTERDTRDLGTDQEINLTYAAITKLVHSCGGSIRIAKGEELGLSVTLPRVMHSFSNESDGGVAA